MKQLVELAVPTGNLVAMDIETDSPDDAGRLALIQVFDGKKVQIARPSPESKEVIKEIFETKEVMGFNFQFDLWKIAQYFNEFLAPKRLWDLRVLSIMDSPGSPASLQEVCARHGIVISKELQKSSWGKDLTQEQLDYASTDVEVLFKLFKGKIRQWAKTSYGRLECDFAVTCAYMTWCGIPVDSAVIAKLKKQYTESFMLMNVMKTEGLMFPHPLNHNSHKDIKEFFKSKYSLSLKSTNVDYLTDVKRECSPDAARDLQTILDKRSIEKSIQYLDQLELYQINGRVHPKYNPLVRTAAGRSSCKEPNAQNPPSAYADSKIRSAFSHDCFFYFDLPNIHGRIAAELSGDSALLKIFKGGMDLHSVSGASISYLFDLEPKYEDYTEFVKGKNNPEVSRVRETAKAVFYGSLNGQGIGGVTRTLAAGGIAVDEAVMRNILKEFKRLYKDLSAYIRKLGTSDSLEFKDGFKMNVSMLSFNERVSRSWLHYEAVIIKYILNKVRVELNQWVEINNFMHDSAMFSLRLDNEVEFTLKMNEYYQEIMRWFFKRIPIPDLDLKKVKEMPA